MAEKPLQHAWNKQTNKREQIASSENLLLVLKGALGEDFRKDKWLLSTVSLLACGGPIRQQWKGGWVVNSFEGPVEPALKEFLKIYSLDLMNVVK